MAFTDFAGWTIPRLTEYCGKFLRHGNSYPDRTIRLFNRRFGSWAGYEVHESIKAEGPVGKLNGNLEHYSYRDLDDHLGRMHRYATLMADELMRAGRRKGLAAVIINPPWRFLRGMIIKGGFLDGWRGLAFHLIEARYVREKYLRMWLASRAEGRTFVQGKAKINASRRSPGAQRKRNPRSTRPARHVEVKALAVGGDFDPRIVFYDPLCPAPYSRDHPGTRGLGGSEASAVRVAEALNGA